MTPKERREYLANLAKMERAGDAAKVEFSDLLAAGDKNLPNLINAIHRTFERQDPPIPWPVHWKRGRRRKYG